MTLIKQIFLFVVLVVLLNVSYAQIATDGSLGAGLAKPLEASDGRFDISSDLGKVEGNNLFHSFDTFNVNRGEIAHFSGPSNISNILSRVTGNSISKIDGSITATMEQVDFYLLNPNGVMIGEHANLDTLGTFHVSTADGITLYNTKEKGFFAASLNEQSTFVSAPPLAFGFLDQPSPQKGNITISSFKENSTYYAPQGIIKIVPTMDLTLENGKAIRDNIFLAPAGEIHIDAPNFDVAFYSSFLKELETINFSYLPSYINNDIFELFETEDFNPAIFYLENNWYEVVSPTDGRYIAANLDTSVNEYFHNFGKRSGLININVKSLTLDGGLIQASNFSENHGGNDIIIEATNRILLRNGASILNKNLGSNEGGNIIFKKAQSLELDSTFSTALSTDYMFDSLRRRYAEQEEIFLTGITMLGDSGTLDIDVNNLILKGDNPFISEMNTNIPFISSIQAVKRDGKTEIKGNIEIKANTLSLSTFSNIVSSDIGNKISGDISITADKVILDKSAITNTTATLGDNGNVSITADKIELYNESEIGNFNLGIGNSGKLTIDSREFNSYDSKITTESIRGNGGEILINNQGRMHLRNSEITTTSAEKAGNIFITNQEFFILDKSNIFAITTNQSDENQSGGDIEIYTNAFIQSSENSIFKEAKYTVFFNEETSREFRYDNNTNNPADDDVKVFLENSEIIDASSREATDGQIRIEAKYTEPEKGLLDLSDVNNVPPSLNQCEDERGEPSYFLVRGVGELLGNTESNSARIRLSREAIPTMPTDWLPTGALAYFDSNIFPDTEKNKVDKGLMKFNRGQFTEAITYWDSVLKSIQQTHQNAKKAQIDLLSHLAGAYQHMGMYYKLFDSLDEAMFLARQEKDKQRQATLYSQFSDAWLAIGHPAEAIKIAETGLGQQAESVLVQHAYANAHAIQAIIFQQMLKEKKALKVSRYFTNQLEQVETDFYAKAESYYQQALSQSKGDGVLQAKIQLNYLRTLSQKHKSQVSQLLQNIPKTWEKYFALPDGYAKATILIAAADLAENVCFTPCQHNILKAYQSIQRMTTNRQVLSIAHARLGQLYQKTGQTQKAVDLTQRAIFYADGEDASAHLLYQWQQQQARLYKTMGKTRKSRKVDDKSLTAEDLYERAVNNIFPLQSVLTIGYRNAPTFNQQIKSVYYELIDMLANENTGKARDKIISYISQLKELEIENYFNDECMITHRKHTSTPIPPQHTAIVYPIILEDKLLILVTIGEKTYQYETNINRDRLLLNIKKMHRYSQITDTYEYIPPAQYLYKKLIAPINKRLTQSNIKTLVFVPDVALYNIPFASLLNDTKFLINDYAVAITPHAYTVQESDIDYRNAKLFLAGTVYYKDDEYRPLTHVTQELDSIKMLFEDKVTFLSNEKFNLNLLEKKFKQQHYNVVHFATHAQFDANPDFTFLVTYDGAIKMDTLENFVASKSRQQSALDLLVLSACETAVGNEWSGLGMAGVTYKAGARATLASLWRVYDDATAELMSHFYRELITNSHILNKAQVLQNAQNKMRKQQKFAHPAFWASFSLVGDWL